MGNLVDKNNGEYREVVIKRGALQKVTTTFFSLLKNIAITD